MWNADIFGSLEFGKIQKRDNFLKIEKRLKILWFYVLKTSCFMEPNNFSICFFSFYLILISMDILSIKTW